MKWLTKLFGIKHEAEQTTDPRFIRALESISKKDGFSQVKVGDWLYLGTEKYLGHGVDDIEGGWARIKSMMGKFVEFEGFEGNYYNLEHLLPAQDGLRQEFDSRKAQRNPDNRREFNDWA